MRKSKAVVIVLSLCAKNLSNLALLSISSTENVFILVIYSLKHLYAFVAQLDRASDFGSEG